MDAQVQSSDARAELALLRRRAYGPDADIHRDPEAVARLAELEIGTRTPALPAASPDERSGSDRPPAEPGGSADPTPSPPHPRNGTVSAPDRRRGLRILTLLAVAFAAAILGAVATAGILTITAPGPDVTLQRDDVDPLEDPAFAGSWIGSFRVDRQGLQAFEEHRGYRPWVGTAADGLVCLFVTAGDRGPVQWDCVPPGMPPVADVQVGNGTISLGGGPRMVVRFEVRDDVIWVYDRPAETQGEST